MNKNQKADDSSPLDEIVTLQPCPFCGSFDLGIGRKTEDHEGWPTYLYCVDCGAQGPWIYTRDKAIFTNTRYAAEKTGWNARTR